MNYEALGWGVIAGVLLFIVALLTIVDLVG